MLKPLSHEQLKELVLVAAENLNIRYPTILEKDYYVSRIIHALSDVENEYFRLIFAGGTCLAKAHKIVKRMSEDIDFKIQVKNAGGVLSNSRMLKKLKEFRAQIMSVLSLPDLSVSNIAVRNEGKYSRAELSYPALFTANDTLRPNLLLEFTVSDIRLSTEFLSINSIISDVLKIDLASCSSGINCVSLNETAIEKWVGLTRRIAAIDRKYHYDDPTLVRHIYDLNAINQKDKLDFTFFDLAKKVVLYDAVQFKNRYPEYLEDPSAEIQRSLEILKNSNIWRKRYQDFIDSMVYDKSTTIEYDYALVTLDRMSEQIIKTLEVNMCEEI